ncbi:MAG: NUDIX domain-containing protein [Planctomycetota bacterium]
MTDEDKILKFPVDKSARDPLTVIGIAVVRDAADHFLVGTRMGAGPLANFAEFPGGKQEGAESPEVTAVRECLEETGLRVRPTGLPERVVWRYEHGRLELNFVPCERCEHELVPRVPFRWIPRDELRRLSWPPANEGLIEKFARGWNLPTEGVS